jgi:hypothetical protein
MKTTSNILSINTLRLVLQGDLDVDGRIILTWIWIKVAQDKVLLQDVVNTVINIRVP